jgi:ATP-dependent RNA helicase DeaD
VLLAGGLDAYRVVVESLGEEFDPLDVAAAAVKLADPAASGTGSQTEEHEIPAVEVAPERKPRSGFKSRSRGESSASVFVGSGRADGVRPQDLVGLITKVVKVPARDVGSIQIAERFSLVEVPEKIAEDVIRALRVSGVRGRKVTVRRDKQR